MNGRDPNFWQGLLDFLPITLVAILTFTMGFIRGVHEGGSLKKVAAWCMDVHTFDNSILKAVTLLMSKLLAS